MDRNGPVQQLSATLSPVQDTEVELVELAQLHSKTDESDVTSRSSSSSLQSFTSDVVVKKPTQKWYFRRWNFLLAAGIGWVQVALMVIDLRSRGSHRIAFGVIGALFGFQAFFALMPLKHSKVVLPIRLRIIFSCALAFLTCCCILLPSLLMKGRRNRHLSQKYFGSEECILSDRFYFQDENNRHHWIHYAVSELLLRLVCTVIVAAIGIICFASWHPPSWYCRASTMVIVMMWLYMVTQTASTFLLLHCAPFPMMDFSNGLRTSTDILVFYWITLLLRKRLKALIKQLMADHLALSAVKRRIRISRFFFAFLSIVYAIAKDSSFISFLDGKDDGRFLGVPLPLPRYSYGFVGISLVLSLFKITRMFSAGIVVLAAEANETSGAARAQCLWARDILRLQRSAVVSTIVSSAIYTLGLSAKRFFGFHHGTKRVILAAVNQVLFIVINAFFICRLSGSFAMKKKDHVERRAAPKQPIRRTTIRQPRDDRWTEKVHELATRGFAISDLLKFYESLGQSRMPSFDPLTSTTNDVVRAAIIPSSRDIEPHGGGCALASVWNDGLPLMPQKMVTHSWGNLFCHLCCAIIGDAMQIDTCKGYSQIEKQLVAPGGIDSLRRQLQVKGKYESTYWVCAFSVNQHAGICGSFGPPPSEDTPERIAWEQKKCDSVTGIEFSLCSCLQEKLFTGLNCEMNKFDDMMVHLSTTVPSFSQVVAVDEDFGLFERAWCVAELVEADGCGLHQNMLIHSDDSLDGHYHRLKDLDVRECQASRKEDKDEILAKIDDVEKFNSQLQHLIFDSDGLFKTFSDGMNQSATAGRIVRRSMKRAKNRRASEVAHETAEMFGMTSLRSTFRFGQTQSSNSSWDE